ncbi:MarR family winged helix-turn-helix transcriptional regulator [Actinacidiphila bryophytorum]|nr:MarR family transcriptional regulator [Actinacidiphila bryophytorum]MBM9439914.1 MarR family transcriptional regulator [Actinacidiphila bryophytorum]MBN6546450.1 MarR family transcriptional regulator [Actinacidiphila bryophytorum]
MTASSKAPPPDPTPAHAPATEAARAGGAGQAAEPGGGAARLAADLRAAIGPLVRRLRRFRPDDELTLSQTSVLVRLDREGPATGSELAAGEGVRPQSMAAILGVLHERGLVTRASDPADGRRILVSLSEAGRAGLSGARRERGRRLTQAISDELTPEEQAVLAAALPLLERITRHV